VHLLQTNTRRHRKHLRYNVSKKETLSKDLYEINAYFKSRGLKRAATFEFPIIDQSIWNIRFFS